MRSDRILLAHGSGGTMMAELIKDVFMERFGDPTLHRMDDASVLDVPTGRIAMSTDTYVVSPVFFPGGDIGRLAVAGTVNDIATSGATPLYLTVGFVLEEGFLVEDLRRILVTMADTADEAGVRIVTGDTKVVERGHGDGIYIRHPRRPWHRGHLGARGPDVHDDHRDRRRSPREAVPRGPRGRPRRALLPRPDSRRAGINAE
jgi:hydrogenase expression/formation protein HypE